MLLRSGARRAGSPQDYSAEMLATEINGVRQGANGFNGRPAAAAAADGTGHGVHGHHRRVCVCASSVILLMSPCYPNY